jgi:hypothetical protein
MLSLIGQQNGLAKAKPLSMHNKTLIPTRCRTATAGRHDPGVGVRKGFARRPIRVISVARLRDPMRVAIIDPKDRAHVPHAKD